MQPKGGDAAGGAAAAAAAAAPPEAGAAPSPPKRTLRQRVGLAMAWMGLDDAADYDGKPRDRWVPEEEANLISRLFFFFANSLVRKGARKHLEMGDLWDTAVKDEPDAVWGEFRRQLAATAKPDAPNGVLWRALWKSHGRVFVVSGALKVFHDGVMFLQPFILEQLLNTLAGDGDRYTALAWSFALLGAAVVEATTVNIYFNMLFRISLHVKTELLELLYRKSLRVSSAVKGAMGVGTVRPPRRS
ncbi:MAG: hypothetical protein J3K34DRAFT_208343 [Monoraphidium minutum]|nr:MAG: hypothetical protein J3K34DRAFT_208343 [Monoraphidium minutum]